MATVNTSATPYCTVADLFTLVDWRLIADWCSSNNGPRPTKRALKDTTSQVGAVAYMACMVASGEIETYALAGAKYQPSDLQSLTGATQAKLKSIAAGCALWTLARRRNPVSADPRSIPGAMVALECLEALRKGERIFSIVEVQQSAKMETVDTTINDPSKSVVLSARRFFGTRITQEGW